MKLAAEQIDAHLNKHLAPLYFVSGDEPLLKQEYCDAVRAAAKKVGYLEREVLSANAQFNWQHLLAAGSNLSLFSSKRIIELTFSGKPGQAGGKILRQYAGNLPADTLLLLISNKLEGNAINSAWVKALDKVGIVSQIWPINAGQYPRFLQTRLSKAELTLNPAGLQLLAEMTEGNLLAAQQAILKLQLTHGAGANLNEQAVAKSLSDHSQYDVFNLVDAALAGNAKRSLSILEHLFSAGIEPILILWALARETRSLLAIYADKSQLQTVWKNRQALVTSALLRLNVRTLQQGLMQAADIDRAIKGVSTIDVKQTLTQLCLRLAGKTTLLEHSS